MSTAKRELIIELRAVLKEIMEWIDNWEPDFVDDAEWDDTKEKIDNVLEKSANV